MDSVQVSNTKVQQFFASFIYHSIKFTHAWDLLPRSMTTDKDLSEKERAEKYFHYEVTKAPLFDQTFDLNCSNKTVSEIGSGFGGYLYHALKSNAQFVYGIEVNRHRYSSSLNLLKKFYDGDNYELLRVDARNMNTIESNSIDIVVSDATLEHISQLDKVLQEIARVLKWNGQAFLATSPIWLTWNGAHLIRYLPIPWGHLILPDSIIYKILELEYRNGDFPRNALENIMVLYKTIGKLTIKKLKREIEKSTLDLVKFENHTKNAIKKILIKLPVLEEFFAGNIVVTLRKTSK